MMLRTTLIALFLMFNIDSGKVAFPQSSSEPKEKIVIIPLNGTVGFIFGVDNLGSTNWFNHQMVDDLLKTARRIGGTTIYFEITSNGGYVIERDKICEVIQKYRNDFEFVAYPHRALSAASTIAMTCDRMIASPNSMVGAAVVISGGKAVDKKYASADASQVRTFYANAGKPTVIADAFSIMETSLWCNYETGEFSINNRDSQGWSKIVDEHNILTFDSQQLRSEERRVGKECRSRWSPYH